MAEIHAKSGNLWASVGPEEPGKSALLLIHGAGGSRLDWPAELRRMTAARLIAVDLAGHGRSAAPVRATINAHAADLVALLDALDLPSAVLAGHSMGGAIALQTALDAPGRVAGLVLISTGARLRVSHAILQAAAHPPELARLLRDLFWGESVPEALKDAAEARIAEAESAVLTADFAACNAFDVRARLADITAPALVLCGDADQMTPPALSEALTAGLPEAQLIRFEGAGHRLPEERPGAVAAHMQRWLGER
jgi:pimeloyl-ACP methyl ester carboxylesterase